MTKTLVTLAIAGLAGFLGGIAGTLVVFHHGGLGPQQVIRAKSFELLDETKNVVSRWGTDQHHNPQLVFGTTGPSPRPRTGGSVGYSLSLDDRETQRLAIGLTGDARPFLNLNGDDRKTRASLFVNEYGKPFFLLHDEKSWRVSLGIRQSDTPGVNDNDWGLDFYPNKAGIGIAAVNRDGKSYVRGYLSVHTDEVSFP